MKESAKLYFQSLIGEDACKAWEDSLKSLKHTPKSIRVNTMKTSLEALEKWYQSQGYKTKKSPYSQDGLFLEGEGAAWSLKAPYNMGLCYPQDSASMFAVEWLDPKPGERVIDLTAAPGGKSSHIAQRMQGEGLLLCNDHDRQRLKILHSNLQRLGLWNAYVIRYSLHDLAQKLHESMDKVLLDPSCSGEGLWGSAKAKPEYWSLKAVKRYAKDQYGLLASAFAMLKPGGRLVYSTCTLNEYEDEGPVLKLLKKFPNARLVDIPSFAPEQIPKANGEPLLGVRFWPQITGTKGFFCIAIEKTAPSPEKIREEKASFSRKKAAPTPEKAKLAPASLVQHFETNIGCTLEQLFPQKHLILEKQGHLFVTSPAIFDIQEELFGEFSFPLLRIEEALPTHAFSLLLSKALLSSKHEYHYAPSPEILHRIFKDFESGPFPFEKPVSSFRLSSPQGQNHEYFFLSYENMCLGLAEKQGDMWIPKVAHLK